MGGLSSRTVPAVCTGLPWSIWSNCKKTEKTQIMLLSNIVYHTHDLQIRGYPKDLPLQPQTGQK
jgi:hypothetical protein